MLAASEHMLQQMQLHSSPDPTGLQADYQDACRQLEEAETLLDFVDVSWRVTQMCCA